MPRNVRNFWIEANVDGRPNIVSFGPRLKDGGFDLTIKVREAGGISGKQIHILGRADGETLTLTIQAPGQEDKVFISYR